VLNVEGLGELVSSGLTHVQHCIHYLCTVKHRKSSGIENLCSPAKKLL
jgi:hypothetical protein